MPSYADHAKDLVLLVADLDAENALRGILQRWQSLGIRQLIEGRQLDILRHPQRDPGCRCNGEGFLAGFIRTHSHALIVFDHSGCGWDDRAATDVEVDVEDRLSQAGWKDRCAAIVIDPELEAWVWSESPNVDEELGWTGRHPSLREWLKTKQLVADGAVKPRDPKAALLQAMREANKPPSPRVFSKLAETVSLSRCQDRAFLKLKTTVRAWFPSAKAAEDW
jgi:hypothetical protein